MSDGDNATPGRPGAGPPDAGRRQSMAYPIARPSPGAAPWERDRHPIRRTPSGRADRQPHRRGHRRRPDRQGARRCRAPEERGGPAPSREPEPAPPRATAHRGHRGGARRLGTIRPPRSSPSRRARLRAAGPGGAAPARPGAAVARRQPAVAGRARVTPGPAQQTMVVGRVAAALIAVFALALTGGGMAVAVDEEPQAEQGRRARPELARHPRPQRAVRRRELPDRRRRQPHRREQRHGRGQHRGRRQARGRTPSCW